MEKIKMGKIVEMDGDEMTRIIWQMIKDELLSPYVELNTEYYDLGLPYRDETNDEVGIKAGEAIKKYRVGVKCATITPNAQRVEEYKLKEMWKSPNATIRAILDGTVFRTPILLSGVKPAVRTWEKPITIARHAYGDIYKATEFRPEKPGKAELIFTSEDGETERATIYDFECGGVLQGMYNKDTSIKSFAHSCFKYALDTKQDLWFSTKDTISKKYDQTFKLIFPEIYDKEYKEADVDVEVYKTVKGEYPDTAHVKFRMLPEVTVAAATCKGSYEQMGDIMAAVAQWACDNGYAFNGPAFNIYHVSPHETDNPDEFVTEVCYPVQKL